MTAINSVTDLSHDGEVAVLTLNSPPVNALSLPVREGLHEFKPETPNGTPIDPIAEYHHNGGVFLRRTRHGIGE